MGSLETTTKHEIAKTLRGWLGATKFSEEDRRPYLAYVVYKAHTNVRMYILKILRFMSKTCGEPVSSIPPQINRQVAQKGRGRSYKSMGFLGSMFCRVNTQPLVSQQGPWSISLNLSNSKAVYGPNWRLFLFQHTGTASVDEWMGHLFLCRKRLHVCAWSVHGKTNYWTTHTHTHTHTQQPKTGPRPTHSDRLRKAAHKQIQGPSVERFEKGYPSFCRGTLPQTSWSKGTAEGPRYLN